MADSVVEDRFVTLVIQNHETPCTCPPGEKCALGDCGASGAGDNEREASVSCARGIQGAENLRYSTEAAVSTF